MHNSNLTRIGTTNLVPSNTTMKVFPDRVSSTNYNTFRSNLIISFKL
jgi:hypothetical protein